MDHEVRIIYREWELVVDKALTKQAYDTVIMGSSEGCTCAACKNFIDNRNRLYPDEIKQLFHNLGIDYKKESEITHYCRLENGLHYYGGWFHFKGRFIGKACTVPAGSGHTFVFSAINEHFGIGFCEANHLSFFDDRENLVQVEFDVKIPWTIDKTLEPE